MKTIKGRQWIVTVAPLAWENSYRVIVNNRRQDKESESSFHNCSLDFILSSILREFDNKYKDYISCVQLKEILEKLFPQLDASTVNLPPLDTSLYEQYIEEWNAENLSAKELYGMENLASEHVPKS